MRIVMKKAVKLISFFVSSAFLFSVSPMAFASEPPCKEYIETRSAKQLSKELKKPEKWVQANYRVKLFAKEPGKGKGKVVGKLSPGTRAVILKAGIDSYQVKSHFDGSTGWIKRADVRHVLLLDTKSLKLCR